MSEALRFPAEWESQSAVLIAWPHADTDWAERLGEVEETYVALVAAITRFEPVVICVADDDIETYAEMRLRSNRVATTSNELLASLSLARTEAIRGLGPAGVCPSADGTSCATTTDWAAGWTVWREDRLAGGVVERTVVRYVQPKQRMVVTGPDAGVEFTTRGASMVPRRPST